MDKADYSEFFERMTAVAEYFDKKLSPMAYDIYWNALKDISIDQFKFAVSEIARKSRFFPKACEIIECATGKSGMTFAETADTEAAKVLTAIRQLGSYESVCFDDPVTQAVIAQAYSGWPKMCSELMAHEEKWFLKDFARLYVSFAKGNIKQYGRLCGIIERDNASNGYDTEIKIRYIGNTSKAKQIEATKNPTDDICASPKLIELAKMVGRVK